MVRPSGKRVGQDRLIRSFQIRELRGVVFSSLRGSKLGEDDASGSTSEICLVVLISSLLCPTTRPPPRIRSVPLLKNWQVYIKAAYRELWRRCTLRFRVLS